jgi:prepilin-type N-terminal cleavage/methylation domain-containing protein
VSTKLFGLKREPRRLHNGRGLVREMLGFTLLEVLVALTVLAVGSVLVLSLISGSLGNIRKVQLRTRSIEHAQEVMETALLDKSILQPTTLSGGFEDGSHWIVLVEDYEVPVSPESRQYDLPQNIPVKLLSYTVEITGPGSRAPDYRLHTLKLVSKSVQNMQTGIPQ